MSLPPSPSSSMLNKRHKPSSYHDKENTPPLSLTPAFHRTLGGCHLSRKVSGFCSETPSPSCRSHSNSIESRLLSSSSSLSCVEQGEEEERDNPSSQHGNENTPPLSSLTPAFHRTVGGCYLSRKVSGFCSDSPETPSPSCRSHSNSIESRLLSSSSSLSCEEEGGDIEDEDAVDLGFCTQLDMLIKLCSGEDEVSPQDDSMLQCPLCGIDISQWDEESRMFHANECLDKSDAPSEPPNVVPPKQKVPSQSDHKLSVQSVPSDVNVTPVVEWLHSLGLGKYEAAFIQQEIDWDSLQWLTEEDLITIGVTALGPRKKIMQCLKELRKEGNISTESANDEPEDTVDVTKKPAANRLITEFFSCPPSSKKKSPTSSKKPQTERTKSGPRQQKVLERNVRTGKNKVVPLWCCIPGTPFRVDAFQYLRRDCSHWFLTHFHIDHYQGLTRSFAYGTIYCSMITAKLVNAKIGIPWERLQVLPLNEKINIAGVDVTCYDANHCPGSIVILFEPRNGKSVLHTGDFRFNEELAQIFATQPCSVHTLILDTTYCNPQYNFPKQESVIQFVIEAIQAESFNQKTLFLIGSYTIGKERLFLEVARVLRKKIYVTAAKLRLLECLDLPAEDMQWLTPNERDSHIHVVPMWTIASFKRLKQLSNQYSERFSLIVAFSPTGWAFSKGKKSSGRRWQQGTIIRYEVPYSEHCSFEELKEFVKIVSPVEIIPSVNNEGAQSSNDMLALLHT